ncbi:hypothetical protein A2U01_0062983, partial [Trifolium medium]|nr:hypothetical protein [Trifolium medium]
VEPPSLPAEHPNHAAADRPHQSRAAAAEPLSLSR